MSDTAQSRVYGPPVGEGLPPTVAFVDGNNVAKASYHTTGDLVDSEGRGTGVAFGFLNQMSGLLWNFPSLKRIIVGWDSYPSWRMQVFGEYKMSRRKASTDPSGDNTWDEQKAILIEGLPYFHISQVSAPNLEADDIAGMLDVIFPHEQALKILVSNDKDWLQLVDKNHYVYRTLKKDDTRMVHPGNFEYATGFLNPDEVWEKKAIVGNKDDLPGCPTIGDKRALDWLRDELESKTFTQRIEDWVNSPQYEANVKMARISEARKFGVPDAKLTFARGDQRQNAYDYLEKYQIQSMIDRFSVMWPKFARLRIEG